MSETNVVELAVDRSTVDRAQSLADGIEAIAKWRRVLSVRWLACGAVLGALANWTLVVADPTPWRFVAVCGYSAGVLVPVLTLYWLTHKGD